MLLHRLFLGGLQLYFALQCSAIHPCVNDTQPSKNRIFVLTDIGNEPDDSMSMVRLLVHSDLYDVQGLVAVTSFWLPNVTLPWMIHDLVDAYGPVHENLQSHSSSSFSSADYLRSKISSGPTVYGMQALGALEAGGKLPAGSTLLIDAVDGSDEPLYVQMWGGANTSAAAIWSVNRTRSPADMNAFISKIRVYSISDQDDTGPWIRQNLPTMRYIASRHGFNQYPVAAWTGMSSTSVDLGGPDNELMSQEWLSKNIQVGPLGKHYPDIEFSVEGDTPALLYHIPNGLGDPEHPDWGSWGGRYVSDSLGGHAQYSDAVDIAQGLNGQIFLTNHASIWRWRAAVQHEFAARMQWTLGPKDANNSTISHPPVISVNGSRGPASLQVMVKPGELVTLDASASYSPDPNARLNYTWLQYYEPSSYQSSPADVPFVDLTNVSGRHGDIVTFTVPGGNDKCVRAEDVTESGHWGEMSKCPVLHVVVAAKDASAVHPITRYKRILLQVQPSNEGMENPLNSE
jgi:hypothetical protein